MISLPNPTRTEFADFQAEQDARNTIYLNIVKYGMMLCDALQHNFQERNHGKVGGYDAPNYTWALDSSGRKYHKVFMYINGKRDSIHCFIDKKTGEVFKPASIKAPAKGARYNVLIIQSREDMFARCDWAGGYLYK